MLTHQQLRGDTVVGSRYLRRRNVNGNKTQGM